MALPLYDHNLPPLRHSFDTYAPVDSADIGWNAARRIADSPVILFSPFVLYGPTGSGKTHLLEAIVEQRHRMFPDMPILYMSGDQFMYQFVGGLRSYTVMDFKARNFASKLVVIDGLEFFARKDSTLEEFFYLVKYCQQYGIQMVFSINQDPGTLPDIRDDLRSQLLGGLVHQLHRPTLGQRRDALTKRFDASVIERIDPAVIDLIVERVEDMNKLTGMMQKLEMVQATRGYYVTIDLAEALLADELRTSKQLLTLEKIVSAVCEFYGISPKQLKSERRTKDLVRPRQVAMYLACMAAKPRLSLPTIGRLLGGRDHTTVMHGRNKIEELLSTDLLLRQEIEQLAFELNIERDAVLAPT
jgi:chromosomal replication initiator protein